MDFNMVGPAIALGLSAIGCCIGCCTAGMACAAAMSRTEENHGKFIAIASAPSSQIIYGIVLMLLMTDKLKTGTLSPIDAIAIALLSGLAFMASSVYQGRVVAAGIEASLKQPSIYGKCWISVGIVESFALFAFVFARQLL